MQGVRGAVRGLRGIEHGVSSGPSSRHHEACTPGAYPSGMTSTDLRTPTSAYRQPSDEGADAAPFDTRELRAVALRPHRALDLVLVERARLAKTIAGGENLLLLIAILLATSVLAALPFGAVLGPHRVLRVAALNVGSVALCFPALHVWSGYLGCKNRLGQDLVLALLVSAVAGLFALSFAPIVWFVRLTTSPGSISVGSVSAGLMALSVLAGVVHLARTVGEQARALSPTRGHRLVMVAWIGLLLFVVQRMAGYLELG